VKIKNDKHWITFKSGCQRFTPESIIDISASTLPTLSPDLAALKSASILSIPVEFTCSGCWFAIQLYRSNIEPLENECIVNS